jgi:hypothetical protein
MAFTIWRRLAPDRVHGTLSPALRGRAEPIRGDGPFTLIAFRGHDVITSREVAKALGRLAPDGTDGADALIAAGPNFTAEARALLAARDAQLVTASEHPWTDLSYAAIRRS